MGLIMSVPEFSYLLFKQFAEGYSVKGLSHYLGEKSVPTLLHV